MLHCKTCQAEYEDGILNCADCGAKLEPGPLPIEPEAPPTTTEWSFLTDCANDLDAELMKQLLEAQGVAVLRKGAMRGSYGVAGSVSNWPGERIVLLVPEDQLTRATRIIHDRLVAGKIVRNVHKEVIAARAKLLRKRRIRKPN
jgi:hypothetical protein